MVFQRVLVRKVVTRIVGILVCWCSGFDLLGNVVLFVCVRGFYPVVGVSVISYLSFLIAEDSIFSL